MKSYRLLRLLLNVTLVTMTVLSLEQTSSAQTRGYDFSAGVYRDVTGGDFYFGDNRFFANNIGQRGVVSVGPCASLDAIAEIPSSGYTRFGVAAIAGNCYVALTHNDERDFIIFRADEVTAAGVSMTWKIITTDNRGATLSGTDATRRGYDFSARAYHDVTGGDFYFGQRRFFANNIGQRGVVSVGACSSVDSVTTIPTTGYSRFGVDAVLGNCYVSLTHNDERNFIVFRADEVSATITSITWRIINTGNRGVTLTPND